MHYNLPDSAKRVETMERHGITLDTVGMTMPTARRLAASCGIESTIEQRESAAWIASLYTVSRSSVLASLAVDATIAPRVILLLETMANHAPHGSALVSACRKAAIDVAESYR